MDRDQLAAFVEAALLTSRGPLTAATLADAVGEGESRVETDVVEEILAAMQEEWASEPRRGVRLERVAGGWRCVTPPQLDPYLSALHGVVSRQRLSQAALEVLAIVAYRQPVTLPEINFVRGANSSAVTRTLLDRGLLRVAGRKQVVGRPFLYRTSKDFLLHFGLDRVDDLPDPEELVGEDTAPVDPQ